jgi:hypothetical protein
MNEYILIFRGFGRSPGWCHAVVDKQEKKVLVGELDDNPGTTVTNAVEEVAEGVYGRLLSGDRDFELYEYVPKGLPKLEPTFYRIVWRGQPGRFSMPAWDVVDPNTDNWLRGIQGLVMSHHYASEALRADRKLTAVDAREPENLPLAI